jgi:hypothetical protein
MWLKDPRTALFASACGEEYRRLVDAMEHFAAAHPERTGGFAREFDLSRGSST